MKCLTSSLLLLSCLGCTTMKQSDTSRTGVEQLLISNAVDQSLDKVNFQPIAGAKVFIDPKYLDCVDKNYIMVSLHHRLLKHNCSLVEKAEEADVVCEVASGSVGTDRTDTFFGVPDVPLPSVGLTIPRMPIFTRGKAMGTAKLQVVAYDVKTKQPVINTDFSLARSDHRDWHVLGMGGTASGSVPSELTQHTGESEGISTSTFTAKNAQNTFR